MIEALRKWIHGLAHGERFKDGNEVYLYVTLLISQVFACFVQLGLVVLFALAGMAGMVMLNVLCLLLHGTGYLAVWWGKHYRPGGLLQGGTVLVYAVLSCFLTGFDTLNIFYLMLSLGCQFIVPYAGRRLRTAVGVAMLAAGLTVALAGFWVTPIFDLGHVREAMAAYNALAGFFGLSILLTVVSVTRLVLEDQAVTRLDELTDQANSDTLTGLYNRRYAHLYFDNLLHLPRGEVWCVAMLDVDNFKKLNDAHGHLAGDKVLASLAELMRNSLRSTDNLFRWGGEEFLLVLKGTSLKNAVAVLDRMRGQIEDMPIEYEGKQLRVTVTVGVTVLDLKNVQHSIDKCDNRLYIGKRTGKNKVVFEG